MQNRTNKNRQQQILWKKLHQTLPCRQKYPGKCKIGQTKIGQIIWPNFTLQASSTVPPSCAWTFTRWLGRWLGSGRQGTGKSSRSICLKLINSEIWRNAFYWVSFILMYHFTQKVGCDQEQSCPNRWLHLFSETSHISSRFWNVPTFYHSPIFHTFISLPILYCVKFHCGFKFEGEYQPCRHTSYLSHFLHNHNMRPETFTLKSA